MLAEPNASLFEKISLRQDSCARLLLLLAKTQLSAQQQAEARALVPNITDWREFTELANRKFIAAYAHRHLSALGEVAIPPLALALLRNAAYASVMSGLRVAAAQIAFHEQCIQSTGAGHAYVKGLALAAQCGQQLGDRPSRDIDVLVAHRDFRSVLEAADAHGYIVYVDHGNARRALDKRDMDFLARYPDVVTLIAPGGCPIEVHRQLGKKSIDFKPDLAIATAESVVLSGTPIMTLSGPLHFNYICYHHARHFWSRLHWVVDLVAMARAPDFNRGAVLRLADEIGIRPTIDAALEFCELVSQPGLWGDAPPSGMGGAQFVRACLFNLDGDLELELTLRKAMPYDDFMSMWQITGERHNDFRIKALLRRLRPTTGQHLRRRLPRILHWLYFLRNGAAVALDGARSMVARVADESAPGHG